MAIPPRLLVRMRGRIHPRRYGLRTEQAYVDRIKRFIVIDGKRHPPRSHPPHHPVARRCRRGNAQRPAVEGSVLRRKFRKRITLEMGDIAVVLLTLGDTLP